MIPQVCVRVTFTLMRKYTGRVSETDAGPVLCPQRSSYSRRVEPQEGQKGTASNEAYA